MERDACGENGTADGSQPAVASRAFGRSRDGSPVEASSTELLPSSSAGVSKPTDQQSTQVQNTLIFVLLCAIVSIVLFSPMLSMHH
jgi:hypothetical protein